MPESLIKIRYKNRVLFNPWFMLAEFVKEQDRDDIIKTHPELKNFPAVVDTCRYIDVVNNIGECTKSWLNILHSWDDVLHDYNTVVWR